MSIRTYTVYIIHTFNGNINFKMFNKSGKWVIKIVNDISIPDDFNKLNISV